VALALVAVGGIAVGSAAVRAAEEAQIREEAREALREAVVLTDAYAADLGREARLAVAVREAEAGLISQWMPDEEAARLDAQVRELVQIRRDRDAAYVRILSLLDRTERLAPTIVAHARLHLLRGASRRGRPRRCTARVERAGPGRTRVGGSAQLTTSRSLDADVFRVVTGTGSSRAAEAGSCRFPGAVRTRPASVSALRVAGDADVPEGAHVLLIGASSSRASS
jgi:hypothetical protein